MENTPRTPESQAPRDPDSAQRLPFSTLGKKRVEIVFDEPHMSSDGGAILFREEADRSGIIRQMASVISDERHRSYVEHTLEELLTQRTVQIFQGYEDANDCNTLRDDPVFKMAVGRDALGKPLASQPTMTRFENSVTIRDLLRIGYVFLENFLDSYEKAPQMIVIDMDPTPNRVYGKQQLGFFNAHYDQYCLMPFHVYEGLTGRLITTVIRPGKTPTDKEILAILKRIVKGVRDRYPDCKLLFRADSHHTKPAVLDWLVEHGLWFVLGMATNKVLKRHSEIIVEGVRQAYDRTWKRCRRFHSFQYAAGSWSRKHRIIARAEATENGTDVRYIVTNLNEAGAKYLYEDIYCKRGSVELWIKEHKCFLKSDRTSCHTKEANQFRLFMHSAVYVIMHRMRETVLRGTELANRTFDTIRLRLLKVAVRVQVGKTYIRLHMPVATTTKSIFAKASAMATVLSSP